MLFFTRRAVACLGCGLGSKVVRLWKFLRAGLARRGAVAAAFDDPDPARHLRGKAVRPVFQVRPEKR